MEVYVPEPVRRKASIAGLTWWVDSLPDVVQSLVDDWGLVLGEWYDSGTEAVVANATLPDGTHAVLKIILPQSGAAENEITALTLANGDGLARVFRADVQRSAVLLERLGPMLASLDVPFLRRQEILTDLASAMWRPVEASCDLPNGAAKANRLRTFIADIVQRVPGALSASAIEYAVACTHNRERAYVRGAAVLSHGDVHAWNALARVDVTGGGVFGGVFGVTGVELASTDLFALVDPDGLIIEPEYDLGVILREDPDDGDPHDRAKWLADRTGTNADAIFEWGAIERVTTGLLLTSIDMQEVGEPMLRLAEHVAR